MSDGIPGDEVQTEKPPRGNGSELEAVVMRQNHLQLIDTLAVMLGVAGDESTEARYGDELYKRRVLREAVIALNYAWNGA